VLILPISGRKLKSVIVGIRYMVAASRFETSRNAAVVAWFMLKPARGELCGIRLAARGDYDGGAGEVAPLSETSRRVMARLGAMAESFQRV
jgi:hypothetical protein